MKGFVYLFRQSGTDYVKIGMTETESVESRFQAFKCYSPTGGEVVGVITTDKARATESELHRMYADRRLKGEFFRLTEQDIETILKTYSSSFQIEARSLFELWIANPVNDIHSLKQILKSDMREQYPYPSFDEEVLAHVKDFYPNSFITATEAYHSFNVSGNPSVSLNDVGKILRKNYRRISKKYPNKEVKKVYFIEVDNKLTTTTG